MRLRCACAGASAKFCVIPIAMPASIPINKITTLTHIINEPIIAVSLSGCGFLKPQAERELTGPRLCDLMSRAGLAYLCLGREPLKRFKGDDSRGKACLGMEETFR